MLNEPEKWMSRACWIIYVIFRMLLMSIMLLLVEQNVDCEVGVPMYIAHIAKSNLNYFICVKMIACRYCYVVYKLDEKGLKTNVTLETGCLKSHELKRSVLDLVHLAQTSYFGNENVHMIAKHGHVHTLSHCKKVYHAKLLELKCLLPFFDHNNQVLRVGGRIVKAALPTEMIHQCILPRKHFVTEYFVLHEHKSCNPFGANYVISKLMQGFWLCSGLTTVWSDLSTSMYCKRAKFESQVMGDLPKCLVTVPRFPFESTGCDLWGPMFVRVNCSVVRRWGVLFICMAT